MKEHLESFGYHPFVKTTGSKGLHVLVPIEPKWTFDKVFETTREVAGLFIESHSSSAEFNLHSAPGHVMNYGDAWEGMAAYAVGLHTVRKGPKAKKEAVPAL